MLYKTYLVGVSVLFVLGCGAPPAKTEALVPASGMVRLNGKPAEGVRLIFHPTDSNKSVGGCWAKTDAQGKFAVIHLSNKEGIPAGTYLVTFSQFVRDDGTPLGPQESPTMTKSTESVAPRWSDIAKAGSHNKVVIPDKGSTSLDFNISTNVKK